VNRFFWGALAALGIVAAAYFWKFWKRTRDPLFWAFAAGFFVLALHYLALGLLNPSSEASHYWYLARAAAFGLILWGVVRKNRADGLRR
jgi:hypothetical protein